MRVDDSAKDRFWANVCCYPGDCWAWMGTRTPAGYGMLWNGDKNVGAHRVSHVLHGGEIPKGYVVMHSCDNPWCVRPEHLKSATQKENIADKWRKGRAAPLPENKARGSKHGLSRLHEEDIPVIRSRIEEGETDCGIAKSYRVDPGTIRNIRTGKAWGWLK